MVEVLLLHLVQLVDELEIKNIFAYIALEYYRYGVFEFFNQTITISVYLLFW